MLESLKKIFNTKNNVSDKKINNIKDIKCYYEDLSNTNFVLKYQKDEIGFLSLSNNLWNFEYSDWFKSQNDLTPMFEFPNLEKKYKTEELWPFFASRIPSDKQPKMQQYFENNPKKTKDIGALLAEFGKTSVNNPYKLTVCL